MSVGLVILKICRTSNADWRQVFRGHRRAKLATTGEEALVYSEHSEIRMRERGITAQEVEEALANTFLPPPGVPSVKGHIWGTTSAGRRLRVTLSKNSGKLVVSVVAPEGVYESHIR